MHPQSIWLVFLVDGYFFCSSWLYAWSMNHVVVFHSVCQMCVTFNFFFIFFILPLMCVKWSALRKRIYTFSFFFWLENGNTWMKNVRIKVVKLDISWKFWNWICNYGLLHYTESQNYCRLDIGVRIIENTTTVAVNRKMKRKGAGKWISTCDKTFNYLMDEFIGNSHFNWIRIFFIFFFNWLSIHIFNNFRVHAI